MNTTMKMNELSRNPIANLMKPITVWSDENSAYTKAAQDAAIMAFMQEQSESVRASQVYTDIPTIPEVKTMNSSPRDRYIKSMGTRRTSAILRRLEQKGELVSVLFRGARYYSIPQGERL